MYPAAVKSPKVVWKKLCPERKDRFGLNGGKKCREKRCVLQMSRLLCMTVFTVICIKDYSHRECTSLTDLRGLFFPVVANEFGPEGFWETVCHRRIQYPFIPGIEHLCHTS